jgi:hypothetical protein
MAESGQLHAPAAFSSEKSPWYALVRRLVEPQGRSGRCGELKICHCRESNPDRRTHSPLLYRLSYTNSYNETVCQRFIDFKKTFDSVGREALYNIRIEFGVPMKLVTLIKMCLSERPYT